MFSIIAAAAISLSSPSVPAGAYSDALTKCLVSNTSAADQQNMIRWIFSAVSAHPAVSDMVQLTDEKRAKVNKEAGGILFRLMTQSCRAEMVDALRYEGPAAINNSFEAFGGVAMRGIMTDKRVMGELGVLTTGFDTSKLAEILNEAGIRPSEAQ